MTDQSKKEDFSPYVVQLICCSEIGKSMSLKHLLSLRTYTIETIDVCIRKCIFKFDRTKQEYLKTIIVLIHYADLNYSNPTFDNNNPIMIACGKGDLSLIKIIIEQPDVPPKNVVEIDLSKKDNNSWNFVHYILNKNTNEEEAIEILNYLLKYNAKCKNKKITNEEILLQKDKKGNCALTLILLKGWSKMLTKYFTLVNYVSYSLPLIGNNLIHCAIEGKSLFCLKKILSYASLEDLRMKNKEGNTPSLFANKKKFFFFSKIIDQFELNFSNTSYKQLLIGNEICVNEILKNFSSKEYGKAISMLSIYKVNQTIIGDITNIPCEWNILLTKRNICLQKGISPEHILSKFCDNNSSNKKQSIISCNELSKFFNKYLKDMNIIDHIDEESFPIDVVIYNKVIFFLKIGDMTSAVNTISLYINHIHQQNPDKFYKFIIYVNFCFILTEYFISIDQIGLAMTLIDRIEEYLLNQYKMRAEAHENQIIADYLNQSEILNQFSPTWDESFCYLHLLKALCNFDTAKKFLSEYKKIAKNCNYAKHMKIFRRLKAIYIMIKAKMNYKFNFVLKSFKKISLIKDNFFDLSNEHKLFYYNSIGILNLKLKNFSNAEFMFKTGIEICKKMQTDSYTTGDDLMTQRVNFIIYLKFNLALSLFYQKKYIQSNEILKDLSRKKIMNKNIYLWYRLGLTSLEIHFISAKPNLSKENESFVTTLGYKAPPQTQNQLNNTNNSNDSNNSEDILENDPNNDFDDLYNQFEKEYGDYKASVGSSRSSVESKENKKSFVSNRLILNQNFIHKTSDELNDAIASFKKVIYLQYGGGTRTEDEEVIKSLTRFWSSPPEISRTIKVNSHLICGAYLNYLFCLSITGRWSEALFMANSILENKSTLSNLNLSNSMSNEFKGKINLFRIESLLNLKKYSEAMKCINTCIARQQDNFRVDLLSRTNSKIINDIPFKIGLRIAMINVNCKEGNYDDAEKNFQNLLDNFYKNKEGDIPPYLVYLGVYLYLLQRKMGKAIKLIKTRNFDFIGDNNKFR